MPAPLVSALLGAALRVTVAAAERDARRRIALAFRRRAAIKIAQKMGEKVAEVDKAVRRAEKESAENALQIARELSSGKFSSFQLRMMGHPYRIGGVPPADPAIINRQTGRFYHGWRVLPPRKSESGILTQLVNESPYARYLLRGTSRMIARPILVRIRERAEPRRRALYRAAIRRTLSR